MLGLINMTMAAMSVATSDPAADQILLFAQRNPVPVGIMTTTSGAPISYTDATDSLNNRILYNEYFMDITTHLVQERIPERVVHTKAAGAHGYFEVTNDITDICRASIFSKVGKRTPIFARFSLAVGYQGGMDTARDIRGFAIKFYAEDGNLDLLTINTPVYFYNDPRLFPTFVHAQKYNPATNLLDANMPWDFITMFPESMLTYLYVYGDSGIPDGYRYMPGYPVHTYQVESIHGQTYFIKFHILPNAGTRNLTSEQASRISSEDYDYSTRDLYRAIGNGDYPSWTMYIQVMTVEDVRRYGYPLFDVTRTVPLTLFPLRKVGIIVLNRNVLNHYSEVEMAAFCPINLIRGILGSPDITFRARRIAYLVAQNYRLGPNFSEIDINCPFRARRLTYTRDGRPPVRQSQNDSPNYYPNSFNNGVPFDDRNITQMIPLLEYLPYNLDQSRDLYVGLREDERSRMIANMLVTLRQTVNFLQQRAVQLLTQIHPDLGTRVARGLQSNSV